MTELAVALFDLITAQAVHSETVPVLFTRVEQLVDALKEQEQGLPEDEKSMLPLLATMLASRERAYQLQQRNISKIRGRARS